MGKEQSKFVRPNANVVNEVKVVEHQIDLFKIELYLILITAFVCLNFALKIYSIHNKILKKKYMSKASNLERVVEKI